jgi:phosphate transport system substrate-binding protein
MSEGRAIHVLGGPARPSIAVALLLALGGALGCAGGRGADMVTVKGSDTMVILGQRWAEAYMAAHPGKVIQVTGGGSGTGIAALINGTTDICQASRPMRDEERRQIQQRFGEAPHEILVARDGLAVYLNGRNPVAALTLAQLKAIYEGRVHRWSQLGGADAPIVAYGRENSSGTYEYFKEHVLEKQDFAASIQTLPGTAAVVNAVARDPNGVGYGGGAYLKGVKECAIKRDEATAGVLPSAENVRTGAYPISRGLFFYTRKAPAGAIRAFVDFALSDSGQALVTQVGYFPVR